MSGVSSITATSPIAVDRSTGAVVVSTGTIPITSGGTGATSASAALAALGGISDPTNTRGDIIARGASALGKLSIGASNTVLRSDGTDPVWGAVAATELTGTLPIANGGTNATSAGAARTSLGAAASGANSDITSITGLTTDLSVAQGGTGASTFADNGVLFGNGTSAIGATAVGTATQVLTSNGSGAAPTFQDAGGGAWQLVSTATPSGVASVTDTNINTTTNDVWALTLTNLIPSVAEGHLYFRLGDSSGIDNGASDYAYHSQYLDAASSSYSATANASAAQMILRLQAGGVTTGRGISGIVFIYKGPDNFPMVTANICSVNYLGATHAGIMGGRRTAAITLDRYELSFHTGNIASGTLRLYKLANS